MVHYTELWLIPSWGGVIPYYLHNDVKRSMPHKVQCRLILKAVRNSKRGDIFILWGGGSIFLYLLTRFFFRHRKVMFQNLIFNPEHIKQSKKAKLLYLMYKDAFHSGGFYANVNGEGLQQYYADLFHCSKDRFPIVYDSMELSDDLKRLSLEPKKEEYVFAGGSTERDVVTFTKIVRAMPDVKFKCVFRKDMIIDEMKSLLNLEIFTDVSPDKFYSILGHASYCCIPLKSIAPCGLLVMQRAALMGIPIVSTETFSMRTIIPSDDYGFLCKRGDVDDIVSKLRLLMDNPALKQEVANRTRKRMSMFSYQHVGEQIADAVEQIANT